LLSVLRLAASDCRQDEVGHIYKTPKTEKIARSAVNEKSQWFENRGGCKAPKKLHSWHVHLERGEDDFAPKMGVTQAVVPGSVNAILRAGNRCYQSKKA